MLALQFKQYLNVFDVVTRQIVSRYSLKKNWNRISYCQIVNKQKIYIKFISALRLLVPTWIFFWVLLEDNDSDLSRTLLHRAIMASLWRQTWIFWTKPNCLQTWTQIRFRFYQVTTFQIYFWHILKLYTFKLQEQFIKAPILNAGKSIFLN